MVRMTRLPGTAATVRRVPRGRVVDREPDRLVLELAAAAALREAALEVVQLLTQRADMCAASARRAGATWEEIGAALGMTSKSAW